MEKLWSLKLGDIRLTAGTSAAAERPDEETPFRILLLGNFSGRAKPAAPLASRRPVLVDRDNFTDVLAKLDVQVHLPAGEGLPAPLTLRIRELDDFHPDRLYERLELFAALRDLRRRLDNPKTYRAAADEVRGWAAASSSAPAPAPPERPQAPPPRDPAALLEQMLGDGEVAAEERPSPGPVAGDWSAFLRQVVSPYLIPGMGDEQEELIARVDEATGAQLRAVLHHPAFQAVEAAWRAVDLLVRRLDTDEGLKVYLLNVGKEELSEDLAGVQDLRASAAYRLLVEQTTGTPGGQPWALWAGNYTFGPAAEDGLLLARLGLVAQAAGAPFLAAADSRLFGCASLAATPDPDDWMATADDEAREVWAALRATPQAAYLGLAAPRFLLRLPYGKEASITEAFAFEELSGSGPHEAFLWGNPAFACALLLGEAYNRAGWELRPGMIQEVGSLPAYVYEEDGESTLKPCAEGVLRDRACERILAAGVMPLQSFVGADKVRLARFQSLAESPAVLAGRWQ
jgi:type VI secretion system protein ImpC